MSGLMRFTVTKTDEEARIGDADGGGYGSVPGNEGNHLVKGKSLTK